MKESSGVIMEQKEKQKNELTAFIPMSKEEMI